MQFRVLGALEVWDHGERVRIEGAKPAKALAVLLLEANHTLPVSRLIEALWDDEPPATARRQVQNYLARLRRELAARGRDPIERIGEGYRLATDDLDWLHFQRDVARARSSMDAEPASEARDLLERALGRWRGPALAGLESRMIASASERLNRARLAATELLIGVELELGEYESAIERARSLLDADPYRQKTAGQLMLALHWDGRSAEALEVYADIRARLAEELGLDPGHGLQRVHRRILRNEAPAVAARPRWPR